MNIFNINNIKPHWYISAIQYKNATGDVQTIDFFFSYVQKMFEKINGSVEKGKHKMFFVIEPVAEVDMAIFHRLLGDVLNYYGYPFKTNNVDEPFSSEKIAYTINLTLYGGF